MNDQDRTTFDPRIADWLEGDANEAPEQALQVVLAAFPSIRQRHGSPLPWRTRPMNQLARMAVAAIAVAVAIGGAAYLLAPRDNVVGPPPVSTASPGHTTLPTPAGPISSPSARASATLENATARPLPSQAVIAATREVLLGPWRSAPLAIDSTLLASIDRVCRADIPVPESAVLVVADARGGASIQAEYASPGGSSAAECIDIHVLPSGDLQAGGAGGYGSGQTGQGPLGALELRAGGATGLGGSLEHNIPATLTVTSGRAGAGIANVTIQAPGWQVIVATISNGWWVAAWPGPVPSGATAVGHNAHGDVVAIVLL